jgi:hypothetical protein
VEQAVLSYDTDKWLEEHGADPMHPTAARQVRNREWFHMIGDHVFSMPDKWEYPWLATWDLAFHTLALSTVDIDFAKEQLDLLLRQVYLAATENRIRAGADAAMGYPHFGMIDLLKLLGGLLVGLFRSRAVREAEMAFLHQQLVVLQRSAPARLRLRTRDRLIFVWLYRLFPCLLDAAVVFKPVS